MEELSYSLHLGNDKNKSKKARRTAKMNDTNTTSFNNNAIQNHQQLSKVDKHNLRKYDDDKELICIIKGTSSIVEDTKKLYLELFKDARIKYNEKQTRNDRKIENYFNHISNDNKRDLACEIIIELGDMDFWIDKDDNFKHKMIEVFKEQIVDLEEVVPNFKIANATIHFDESSPHLHIVGVPFKDGMKNGMEKQVGKSDVFTKETLTKIQDKIRIQCMESFNKEYHTNYKLKPKLKGRNRDYHISEMGNYQKMKTSLEIHQNTLNKAKDNTDNLKNSTKEIRDMLENLKSKGLIKNQLVLDVVDRDKAIVFIDLIDKTIMEYESIQELTVTLKEVESELLNNRDRIRLLLKNNEELNSEVDNLN